VTGLALAVGAATSGNATAAISGMTPVATGLTNPIFVTHAPGDRTRLYIAQRNGVIRILNLTTGSLEATPFLSIPDVVTGDPTPGAEGGLLGLAFHPDYANNGKFYVYVTAADSDPSTVFSSYVRQYSRSAGNPNIADTTASAVISWGQPQVNHNAGWIGFSPKDNFLYISSGDGGGSNDNQTGHTAGTGNAQDITNNFLGKMLRIDVDGDQFDGDATRNYRIPNFQMAGTNPFAPVPDPNNVGSFIDPTGDDEIWAYGLRNPFRDSFDRATGDLWIGDVGQGAHEEVDRQPNGVGGQNYGWRIREGLFDNPANSDSVPSGLTDPVFDYAHSSGSVLGVVITGGYVYRGPDPSLQGKYFFLDSNNTSGVSDDRYFMFDSTNPAPTLTNIKTPLAPPAGAMFPVTFGEDAVGNLYIAYLATGQVYRINTNQVTPGDFDADAAVDDDDLAIWRANLGLATGAMRDTGDADGDGDVDGRDFLKWQQNYGWTSLSVTPIAVVPEPAGAVLVAAAGLAIAWRRSRRGGQGGMLRCRRLNGVRARL
jgi:glucose/arabinose dehydrogenase